ncbi:hypothetical protein VTK73DRAFT_2293 [Phialemonium thermophilum]|uniref:Uncharacterized protein n=1 Tax=Phialemonium thermophilum TaxID=223376 RepID=A0ABR3VSC1_9PEZI
MPTSLPIEYAFGGEAEGLGGTQEYPRMGHLHHPADGSPGGRCRVQIPAADDWALASYRHARRPPHHRGRYQRNAASPRRRFRVPIEYLGLATQGVDLPYDVIVRRTTGSTTLVAPGTFSRSLSTPTVLGHRIA